MPGSVVGRRLADDRPEGPAERSEAREADVEADVRDAALGLAEEEHRPLNAPALQVAVGRLAEDRAEAPAEVSLGDVGDGCDGSDVERLRVGAIHGVAGPEQASIEVLGFAGHDETLRDERGQRGRRTGDARLYPAVMRTVLPSGSSTIPMYAPKLVRNGARRR
jgi:hypothetical protein